MNWLHTWDGENFHQTLILPSESIWEEAERLCLEEDHQLWKAEVNDRLFTTAIINHLWEKEQMNK